MSNRPLKRALFAGALASALAIAGVPAAQAATQTIDDVELSWGLSKEAGGGSYFGGCNFLVAGKAGNAGGSRVWTAADADAFYKASEGSVSIVKDGESGPVAPTWATKCLDASGKAVTTSAASSTNNRVQFSGGTGQVDLAAGTAKVSWEGSFTIVFYGGMTYWHASDPELTIGADGKGTLTATAGGYGASMEDSTKWAPLAEKRITLANLSGVSLTKDGLTVTPDYAGVTVTTGADVMGQVLTGSHPGSFPQDFVDFQAGTGQSSYWYSSGGAADPKKPATALTVGWNAAETTDPEPEPGETQGDVDVNVVVPEVTEPEPGALKLSVNGSVNLGEAASSAAGFTASGKLPEVTVSDTRTAGTWTANASLSSFTSAAGSIPASALGWAPSVISGDAQAGAAVTANTPGLGASATLGSGAKGEAKLGADLSLVAPASTKAGSYKAKLTLTAVG